jgi:hypothetical protein
MKTLSMRSSQISAIFPYDLEAKASVSGLKSIAAASSDTYNYHYGFLFPHFHEYYLSAERDILVGWLKP